MRPRRRSVFRGEIGLDLPAEPAATEVAQYEQHDEHNHDDDDDVLGTH